VWLLHVTHNQGFLFFCLEMKNEESSEKLKEKDRIINLLAKEMRAPSNENSSEASYRNNEITDQISLAKEVIVVSWFKKKYAGFTSVGRLL